MTLPRVGSLGIEPTLGWRLQHLWCCQSGVLRWECLRALPGLCQLRDFGGLSLPELAPSP